MPDLIRMNDDLVPVATEQELLDFVNKGREAGGANMLEALLPSVRTDAAQCLIATALNFGCEVRPGTDDDRWIMVLPSNIDNDRGEKIADALGCEFTARVTARYRTVGIDFAAYLTLPEHIGNAADAFDRGLAFQDYALPEA